MVVSEQDAHAPPPRFRRARRARRRSSPLPVATGPRNALRSPSPAPASSAARTWASCSQRVLRVEASAVVGHVDAELLSLDAQRDERISCAGMLAHVAERLLDDSHELELGRGREPERLRLRGRLEPERRSLYQPELAEVGAQVCHQPVPRGRPQADDRLPHVVVDVPRRLLHGGERLAGGLDPPGVEQLPDRERLRVDVAEDLSEPVVQLTADALPLLEHGGVEHTLVQAGVLDRDRHLLADPLEQPKLSPRRQAPSARGLPRRERRPSARPAGGVWHRGSRSRAPGPPAIRSARRRRGRGRRPARPSGRRAAAGPRRA